MRLLAGFGLGTLATIMLLGVDMAAEMRTASAQGGIVCEYGTAKYRRCCRESYRNNPDLGPRGRARDIDACMNRDSSEQPERSERREQRREQRGKDERGRDERGTASTGLRRLDCSADGCQGGCGDGEVVISAFCPSGAPTVDGDRDVKCAQGRERPAVLVCAKR
jgi:hypothetical protein